MEPENPIVDQLIRQSKVLHRLASQQDIYERKGDGFIEALTAVEESSIPGDFNILFPKAHRLEQLDQAAKRNGRHGQLATK